MSISAEEKVCYLREAAIVLAKEGFQLDEVHTDRLCIQLDGMGYDVERLRPEGKDWNDDLRAKRGKAKTPTA